MPIQDKKYQLEIPSFKLLDATTTEKRVGETITAYNDAIRDIVNQLNQNGLSNEAKVYCIYLLGQLHAAEGVSVLIDKIETEANKVDPKDRIGRWGKYPAQEALAKIGKSAANAILEKLGQENNELRRNLMVLVIIDVEGKEIGKIRIQKALEIESNVTAKGNLVLAQKLIELNP